MQSPLYTLSMQCQKVQSPPGTAKPVAFHKGEMAAIIILGPFALLSCVQDQHEEAGGFESRLEK